MEQVSLVIAAYNIEGYIAQCMESCIRQTDKNVEIIAVDDGSEDRTTEILKHFEKVPQVTVLRHQRNKGLSEVRKTGYKAAQGKYLLFIDGDDWLADDAVECLRFGAEDMAADILCYQFYLEGIGAGRKYQVEPFGAAAGDEYLTRLLTGRIPTCITTKFLRKSYLDKNRIAFPSCLNCGEDVAIAASLGVYSPKAAFIAKPLYHYRISPDSLSAVPSACMLDILPATLFAEKCLRERGLYDRYQAEYEYYAFLHNLFYRFDAMFTRPNPYRQQLYQNWLSLHIRIADNPYFQQNFSADTPKNRLMKSLGEQNAP